jgi:hypothetical protein
MPTGARAGTYSKHISKLCCRCANEETDIHLFFLCPYARAAWFADPWFLKIDQMVHINSSLTQILQNLLNMHHPNGSMQNILTFLWCIWKARNDCLFNKKDRHPSRIIHMANSIINNMEMTDVVQGILEHNLPTGSNHKAHPQGPTQDGEKLEQGQTLKSDLQITGSKIYTDASWKTKKIPGAQGIISTGLGVFCHLQRQNGEEKILIQASTLKKAPSSLIAEAIGLSLGAELANKIGLHHITFLTDNLTLAKAAAANKISDKQVPWELREQIANYQKASRNIEKKVFHIPRNLNGIAHDCAKQAFRQDKSLPIFSCSNSAHSRIGNFPIASTLSQIHFEGIVLHAVNCL